MIESRTPESLPDPRNLRDDELDDATGGRNSRPTSWLEAIAQAIGEAANKKAASMGSL
jgi:hypothetical protein